MTLRVAVQKVLIGADGARHARVLASQTPLSLWGGVDPSNGRIIDQHHPLHAASWNDRALVIPRGRGSCTGSAVLLEAIHAGHAPALIVLREVDAIIALGAIVAEEVLGRRLPIVVLGEPEFAAVSRAQTVYFDGHGHLLLDADVTAADPDQAATGLPRHSSAPCELQLSAADARCLAGAHGEAARVAMRIIQRMAQIQQAPRLLDVTRVHVDACIYTGPAGLAFARQLVAWGGQVAVATTLNAISVARCWGQQVVSSPRMQPAMQLAEAYRQLGAQPTYTCAPYLLAGPPQAGETIAWAESNAVVFANSVLGAHTDKTPDLLDVCIALTGRAPIAGYYRSDERRARVVIHVPPLARADDALYPLLGYAVGEYARDRVPVVVGLQHTPSGADLKAFGAAFATTASAGLFHIPGVTPEAPTLTAALAGHEPEEEHELTHADLRAVWGTLNAGSQARAPSEVDVVALGNPHFSAAEFAALARLCSGRSKHERVDVTVTTSRHVASAAEQAGDLDILQRFGVRVITDSCWCMLQPPVIAGEARVMVTNSAKYAHYGPGLVGKTLRFASLAGCVTAAVDGHIDTTPPRWLQAD